MEVNEIKLHLGQPAEIEIESNGTKTKFKMSPLPTEMLPELYQTLKMLKGSTKGELGKDVDPSAIFENLTEDVLETIANLGLMSLKPNYPDIEDKDLKELVLRNIIAFAGELWSQNLNMRGDKIAGKKGTGTVKSPEA